MLKIEKFLFYLFTFLLPFQIGKFLFAFSPLPDFFYHQFFIYLSDILIFLLLAFWIYRIIILNQERQDLYHAFRKDFSLILFLLFVGVSIFVSANKGLSIFHFLKLAEFASLYFYIRQNFRFVDIKKFSDIVIASAVLQSIIAGVQFYLQKNIGLNVLGESPLSPIIDGVAKINEGGFKLIRAYGTFPHPNILAAFISFALFMSYSALLNNKAEIRQESVITPLPYYSRIGQRINSFLAFKINKYVSIRSVAGFLLLFSLVLGLFLTFSKIAIASFAFGGLAMTIFLFILKNKINMEVKKIYKLAFLSLIIFATFIFIFNKELSSRISESDSISQRIFYSNVSIKVIARSPIFGVGIGNFTDYFYNNFSGLPDWQYQPVHNLFLLATAETGLVGGALFMLFLGHTIYRFFKRDRRSLFEYIILFATVNFLILANFDHYFWTLQQGRILFWLVLGILNSHRKQ